MVEAIKEYAKLQNIVKAYEKLARVTSKSCERKGVSVCPHVRDGQKAGHRFWSAFPRVSSVQKYVIQPNSSLG